MSNIYRNPETAGTLRDLRVDLAIAHARTKRFIEAAADDGFDRSSKPSKAAAYAERAKLHAARCDAIKAKMAQVLQADHDYPPLTEEQIDMIKTALSATPPEWRADKRSEHWVGHAIEEVVGWVGSDQIERRIQTLIRDGVLKTVEALDDRKRVREYVVAA
jgi:hypothetical protein